MKSFSRLTVKMALSSLVLGIALLSFGCEQTLPKQPTTAPTVNSSEKPVLGKGVPASVSGSIKDSQMAGEAYRNQAMKNGAASGAASTGWR